MSIYLGNTKLSDKANTEIPVGGIFESTSNIKPTYGNWEVLPDRCEDSWKIYPITYVNQNGTLTSAQFLAKVTEDGKYLDAQFRGRISVEQPVSTTTERLIANEIKINDKLVGTLTNLVPMPLTYFDATDATRTCGLYLAASNKLWFGGNTVNAYTGTFVGRKLTDYNDVLKTVFTPDRTIKRWKRIA